VQRFVVLLEPAADGAIARAALAGIVPVHLKVVYEWHKFAHIADDESTHLVSDCVGYPILWKDAAGNEDENGNRWALIEIGGPGVSLGIWKNAGAATVAAHEQIRVTGCEGDGNCLTGRQPDSAHGRQYETNGSMPVPAGKHGVYQKAAVIHVAYAGDAPSAGDRLGPKPGQGTVVAVDPVFVTCDALGVADQTNKVVQARVHAAQGERCVVLRMKSAEAVVLPPDPIRENWTFQVSDPVELWRAENAPQYEPPDEVLNTIGSSLDAGDPVVVLGVYALVGDEYQYLWYAVGTTNTSAVRTVVLTRDYYGGGGINCVWGHFEDDPDQVEHPFTPLGYIDNPSHGILGFAPAGARAVVIVSLWRPFLLLGVEQGLPEDSPGIVIGGEFQTLLEGVVYGSAIERDGTGMVTPYWLNANGEFVQAGTLPIMGVRNFVRRVEAGERVQIHLNPARGRWAVIAASDAKDEKVKVDADDPQAGYLDEKLVTEDPWIGKETVAPAEEPHAIKLRHTGPSTVYCTDDLLGTVEIVTDPYGNKTLRIPSKPIQHDARGHFTGMAGPVNHDVPLGFIDEKVRSHAGDPQPGFLDAKITGRAPWIAVGVVNDTIEIRHEGPAATVYVTETAPSLLLSGSVLSLTRPASQFDKKGHRNGQSVGDPSQVDLAGLVGSDEKVKAYAGDPTPGFLDAKLEGDLIWTDTETDLANNKVKVKHIAGGAPVAALSTPTLRLEDGTLTLHAKPVQLDACKHVAGEGSEETSQVELPTVDIKGDETWIEVQQDEGEATVSHIGPAATASGWNPLASFMVTAEEIPKLSILPHTLFFDACGHKSGDGYDAPYQIALVEAVRIKAIRFLDGNLQVQRCSCWVLKEEEPTEWTTEISGGTLEVVTSVACVDGDIVGTTAKIKGLFEVVE
jgi:hypothetical protein